MSLSSVSCKQSYEVKYKYLSRKQNFLSSLPIFNFCKLNYFVYVIVHWKTKAWVGGQY
jgi:hypothetical protein